MDTMYLRGHKVSPRRFGKMGRTNQLMGFDYRLNKQVTRSRVEWRAELQKVIKAGGRRRIEHGETFGHEKGSLIAFEIYANVSL